MHAASPSNRNFLKYFENSFDSNQFFSFLNGKDLARVSTTCRKTLATANQNLLKEIILRSKVFTQVNALSLKARSIILLNFDSKAPIQSDLSLRRIALVFAANKHHHEVMKTTSYIVCDKQRLETLSLIVKMYIKDNNIPSAKKTLSHIPQGIYKNKLVLEVAEAMDSNKNTPEAIALINTLPHLSIRDRSFMLFSIHLAKRGLMSRAYSIAGNITSPGTLIRAQNLISKKKIESSHEKTTNFVKLKLTRNQKTSLLLSLNSKLLILDKYLISSQSAERLLFSAEDLIRTKHTSNKFYSFMGADIQSKA